MGTEDGARRPSRPLPRRLSFLLCLILVLFFVRPDFYSTPQASEDIIAPPQHTAASGPPPPPCAADGLLTSDDAPPSSTGERFLLYAPQFGLSNQLVALRNAVAWAQLLNRTLVLPHLLAHGAVHPRAPFGDAFDVGGAQLAPLRVIEMDHFLRRGVEPNGVLALVTTNKFRPADDSAYFDSLGVAWHRNGHRLEVSMPSSSNGGGGGGSYSPDAIRKAFGSCGANHAVLAFRSLFAAFDPKPLSRSPQGWSVCGGCRSRTRCGECMPGLQWLDQQALPELLTPTKGLISVAEGIRDLMTRPDANAPDGYELACAHIRRGDFREECADYEKERLGNGKNGRGAKPRPWVVWHHRNGYGCWQSESELQLNLRDAQKQLLQRQREQRLPRKPLAYYVAIEDSAALKEMPTLTPFNLTALDAFAHLLSSARLKLAPALAAILADQLACSQASILLLNAFSTFSQLVLGRLGLQHRESLGWVRDLSSRQQRALGVTVAFWRREDEKGSLAAKY